MKRPGIKQKRRPSLTREEREQAKAFKDCVAFQPCANCGHPDNYVQAHHVVYQQHLQLEDMWRVENALPLCFRCHERHHNGYRVPIDRLTDGNLEFANEVLGAAAWDYINRRYAA